MLSWTVLYWGRKRGGPNQDAPIWAGYLFSQRAQFAEICRLFGGKTSGKKDSRIFYGMLLCWADAMSCCLAAVDDLTAWLGISPHVIVSIGSRMSERGATIWNRHTDPGVKYLLAKRRWFSLQNRQIRVLVDPLGSEFERIHRFSDSFSSFDPP